jgi:hypothetical protein
VVGHLLFVSYIASAKTISRCTIERIVDPAVSRKVESILRLVAVRITNCVTALPYFEVATEYCVFKPCVALVHLASYHVSSTLTHMAV